MTLNTIATNNDFQSSLLAFLDEAEKNEVHDVLDEDSITTKEEANYYIRKVKECQASIDAINDAAENELAKQTERINDWRNSTIKNYKFLLSTYTAKLRDFWFNTSIDGKTIKLSQGSLCMRKMKDKEEYNEEGVQQFIQENNLSQYIEQIVNKKKIKEDIIVNDDGTTSLNINGTIVPVKGFKYIKQDPKFEVK